MKKCCCALFPFLFVLGFSVSVFAAGGQIPVYQATTISTPGSYYLTADIIGGGPGGAITISSSDVTLDLRGHTIYGEVFLSNPFDHVRITNGRICTGRIDMNMGGSFFRIDNLMIESPPGFPGIMVGNATHVVIEYNSLTSVRLMMVTNGRIDHNTISNEVDMGISIFESRGIAVTYNTITNCPQHGIELFASLDCIFEYNIVRGNGSEGMNNSGINMKNCSSMTFMHNNVSQNIGNGFFGFMSIGCHIARNVFGQNHIPDMTLGHGIHLENCDANTIDNNTNSGNAQNGIFLTYANNNTLANNQVSSCFKNGIELIESMNNTLTANNASLNTVDGIALTMNSDNNNLDNNTACSNQQNGMVIWESDNNRIASNQASHNITMNGIELTDSSYNTLTYNTASRNGNDGIQVFGSATGVSINNSIDWNTAGGNTMNGFSFSPGSTSGNIYSHNRAQGNGVNYNDIGGLNTPVFYGVGFPTNL